MAQRWVSRTFKFFQCDLAYDGPVRDAKGPRDLVQPESREMVRGGYMFRDKTRGRLYVIMELVAPIPWDAVVKQLNVRAEGGYRSGSGNVNWSAIRATCPELDESLYRHLHLKLSQMFNASCLMAPKSTPDPAVNIVTARKRPKEPREESKVHVSCNTAIGSCTSRSAVKRSDDDRISSDSSKRSRAETVVSDDHPRDDGCVVGDEASWLCVRSGSPSQETDDE